MKSNPNEVPEFLFMIDGHKYSIPSELFPLSSDGPVKLFRSKDCSNIKDARILRILDGLNIGIGRCYEDSEKILHALSEVYDVKYYAGWLFVGASAPIIHAWVILSMDGETFLIDSAYNKIFDAVFSRLEKADVSGRDEARHFFSEETKRIFQKKKRNSDRMTTGKPPSHYLYVGIPSTRKQAEDVHMKVAVMQNHPSHQNSSVNPFGDSLIQKMIKNR